MCRTNPLNEIYIPCKMLAHINTITLDATVSSPWHNSHEQIIYGSYIYAKSCERAHINYSYFMVRDARVYDVVIRCCVCIGTRDVITRAPRWLSWRQCLGPSGLRPVIKNNYFPPFGYEQIYKYNAPYHRAVAECKSRNTRGSASICWQLFEERKSQGTKGLFD